MEIDLQEHVGNDPKAQEISTLTKTLSKYAPSINCLIEKKVFLK